MNLNFSNIIILGAHYDSRAKATKDLTNPELPVPGANDGASGSAVLIELAKSFYTRIENLSVQIWFLFFDAEDQGYDRAAGIPGWGWCEGSEQFVQDITNFYNSSTETFDAMILLDMVGGTNLSFINEQYSTSSLLDELFQTGRSLGFTNEFPTNPIVNSILDDHVAFATYGIPTADLIINFWNNPNWPYHHTTEDDLSNISNHSLGVTGKTVEQFVYNNYFNNSKNSWGADVNILPPEIIIIILTLSLVGLISLILIIRSKRKIKSN
jgi:Zn-dependent M28 family amino/carboxypeptidase